MSCISEDKVRGQGGPVSGEGQADRSEEGVAEGSQKPGQGGGEMLI